MLEIVFIYGTRPEIIKLAPLIREVQASSIFDPFLLATGQHRELAKLASDTFGIKPDLDLDTMMETQTPNSLLAHSLLGLEKVLQERKPRGVLVQGDTSSALAGALAAFHQGLPVGHVEAGLRTRNLSAPFPEEMNRSCISRMASLHFAPTTSAQENLFSEGIDSGIFVTGNTVVDAVYYVEKKLDSNQLRPDPKIQSYLESDDDLILVTGHRRENFDGGLQVLCQAIKSIARPGRQILFPVHPNPKVQATVLPLLADTPGVEILPPMDYPSLIAILKKARLVVTDSGGIQEEAPSFSTPVLVTRQTTERPEGFAAGTSQLCPLNNAEAVVMAIEETLKSVELRRTHPNPFGDGRASKRIIKCIEESWN